MANHTGLEGIIKVGTAVLAEVTKWSIDEKADTIEDTSMGDTSRTYKTGLKSYSGSVDCHWDPTDTNGQGALAVGATATLGLYPEGTGTTAHYYSATVIVTGVSPQGGMSDLVERNFTFQGIGALGTATV